MKFSNLILLFAICWIISSCGGAGKYEKDKETKISVGPETEISGNLAKKHLKVIPGEYTYYVPKDSIGTNPAEFTVDFKITKPDSIFFRNYDQAKENDFSGKIMHKPSSMEIELIDESGHAVPGIDNLSCSYKSKEKLSKKIKSGNGEISLSFTSSGFNIRDYHNNFDKVKGVKITMSKEKLNMLKEAEARAERAKRREEAEEAEKENESATSSPETATDNEGGDYTEALDAYAEYVDEYVAMMEKVQNGDMSSMSDMQSIMQKAKKFEEELKDKKNEFTESDWERYNEINQRLLKASQKMQKQMQNTQQFNN